MSDVSGAATKSEFKKHIAHLLDSDSSCIDCPETDAVFNNLNEHYELSCLDLSYNISELTRELRENTALNEYALSITSAIDSAVYSFAFRIKCLSELSKSDLTGSAREKTNLRLFLKEYIENVERYIPSKSHYSVSFKNNVKGDVCAYLNHIEFVIILTNLLTNALTHSHSVDNHVDVILNRVSGKVLVSVLDYGVGVDVDKIKVLLKTNAQRLSNGEFFHKGYGLLICQKFARRMNAKIYVSNYPGAGAAFTVVLDEDKHVSDPYLADINAPNLFLDNSILNLALNSLMIDCANNKEDKMTITYEYYNSLYVNITNRCSNACTFCVRTKHDNVNGEDDLWLEREPTVDEIKQDFMTRDLDKYNQVVFCGYGEPTERFDDLISVAKWLKSIKPDMPIRINTNGQANLINDRDVTPDMEGIIDTVSISLNAPNAKEYQELCISRYGEEAFSKLQEFAVLSKKYVGEVVFSVVDKTMPPEDIEACRNIAEKCGVKFRVREYIE